MSYCSLYSQNTGCAENISKAGIQTPPGLKPAKWQHLDSGDFWIVLTSGFELYTFMISSPILGSR